MSLEIVPVTAPLLPDGKALSIKDQNEVSRQLAAGALPMAMEQYLTRLLTSTDVETLRKGVVELAKITRLVDDGQAALLPTINVVFNGMQGYSATVTSPAVVSEVSNLGLPAPAAPAPVLPPLPDDDESWAMSALEDC